MKSVKRGIILLFISLVMVAIFIGVFKWPTPQSGYRFPRHIQYGFILENASSRAIQNAELWTYAPVAQTPTQRCEGINPSHPFQLIPGTSGNQILHFTFDLIPPYATKIVNIEARLLLSEKPDPARLDDLVPYLKAETHCESDDPAIRRLARELETPKPQKTALNIFRWVKANITYSGYARNARGARYALKHKDGDCTEFMYLFVALCRADKVPARCVSGYLCQKDGLLKPGAFHNWAEFYHRGSWWISDPQNGVFMKDASGYIAMRIMNGLEDPAIPRFDRFQFKGEGLKAKMNS